MRCDCRRASPASRSALQRRVARDRAPAARPSRRSRPPPRGARAAFSAPSHARRARRERAILDPQQLQQPVVLAHLGEARRGEQLLHARVELAQRHGQRALGARGEHIPADLRVEPRDALGEHRLARGRVRRSAVRVRLHGAANAGDHRARRRSAATPCPSSLGVAVARALGSRPRAHRRARWRAGSASPSRSSSPTCTSSAGAMDDHRIRALDALGRAVALRLVRLPDREDREGGVDEPHRGMQREADLAVRFRRNARQRLEVDGRGLGGVKALVPRPTRGAPRRAGTASRAAYG